MTVMIGLTWRRPPIAAWAGAVPATLLEVRKGVEGDEQVDVGGPLGDGLGDLRAACARARELGGQQREEPLTHGRGCRVDDVDSATLQHVGRDPRALIVPDSFSTDAHEDDRVGTGDERGVEDRLEVARARRGRRRERGIGSQHPLPELVGREDDPGPEALRAEA